MAGATNYPIIVSLFHVDLRNRSHLIRYERELRQIKYFAELGGLLPRSTPQGEPRPTDPSCIALPAHDLTQVESL